MPIHDWTRVEAGLFHHFHQNWITVIAAFLNAGRLPEGLFALAEQVEGGPIPDVLTLQLAPAAEPQLGLNGGVAVATTPPRTKFVFRSTAQRYARKANRITVRHRRGRVIAVIEIVSPGNKDSKNALRAFVDKANALLSEGIHLLVVDLFPPTPRDPQGIAKAIWDEIQVEPLELLPDKPLTLASFSAGLEFIAHVEPVAVGDVLPEMPLFLEPGGHIPVNLEETYKTAWAAFPAVLKPELEGRSNG